MLAEPSAATLLHQSRIIQFEKISPSHTLALTHALVSRITMPYNIYGSVRVLLCNGSVYFVSRRSLVYSYHDGGMIFQCVLVFSLVSSVFGPGSSRLYRLGVSQAQKAKLSGDERPRLCVLMRMHPTFLFLPGLKNRAIL